MSGEERSAKGIFILFRVVSNDAYCLFLRHAMLVDQKTEQTIVPLNDNLRSEGRLELANSAY